MTYNGRRAPNVSEYIAQLNSIPSAQDIHSTDDFNLDDDLAIFTNTQFFDFDLGQDADLQPGNFDGRAQSVAPDNVEMKALDFNMPGMFNYIISYLLIYWTARSFLPRRQSSSKLASGSLSLLPLGPAGDPRRRMCSRARCICIPSNTLSIPPSGPMSIYACSLTHFFAAELHLSSAGRNMTTSLDQLLNMASYHVLYSTFLNVKRISNAPASFRLYPLAAQGKGATMLTIGWHVIQKTSISPTSIPSPQPHQQHSMASLPPRPQLPSKPTSLTPPPRQLALLPQPRVRLANAKLPLPQ